MLSCLAHAPAMPLPLPQAHGSGSGGGCAGAAGDGGTGAGHRLWQLWGGLEERLLPALCSSPSAPRRPVCPSSLELS